MALKGNAAFLVDSPSGEQVYLCSVPPRIVSTRQIRRRYTEDSLDRRTRNIVTIGAPVYEITMRARFADRPADLLALLDAAAHGYPITYIHDLSQPDGYAFVLIHGDDAIEAVPDPDRFAFAEYDTTLTLRSATPFAPLLDSRGVLFRYHAGGAADSLTFSRASTAYRITRGGVLESVAADVLRTEWLDLDGDGVRETSTLKLERASTNHIRNPRCEGAIVGVVGSGGALPTHWPLDTTSGLTLSVEATGIDAGLPYIDLRIQGTPTGATVLQYFEGATQIAAAPDEVWTGSVYARLVGGSLSGVTDVFLRIAEYQSGGGILRSSQQTIDLANGRHSHTATMGADTGQVRHGLALSVTPGQAVDVTLRIGGPQLEQSPVASSLILPPVGAPAVSSRALDVLTAPWAHGLISCTGYTRFVETGGVQLPSVTVASWFGAGNGLIWVRSSAASPTYWITLRDSRGASAQVQTTPGVTTQVGQLVELMPQVEVSSQGVRARLIQVVDGGDPVTSSWTDYVQADWVPTTLRLVSRESGGNQGQMNLRDALVLRGSDWTMDAARRLLP